MKQNSPLILSLITLILTIGSNKTFSQYVNRWGDEFDAFSNLDKNLTIVPGKIILFTGSSSIRMWKYPEKDFSDPNILNRGFGGSEIEDLIQNFNQIILKYQPSKIVIYSGDNDIAGGKSAEKVFGDFCTLLGMIKATLPETNVIYIAIKPSIDRWNLWDEMLKANLLIKEYLDGSTKDYFVDIYSPMLNSDGTPREKLFIEDGLHLSKKGYKVWSAALKPYLLK